MSRTILAALAAAAALGASPASAQFEGRLDYMLEGGPSAKEKEGSGKAVVWMGPDGARTEMSVKRAEGPIRDASFVTLWRRSEPDRVYFMNDAKKAYSVIEVREDGRGEGRHQITRLGSSKVAGYACERVSVKDSSGSVQELCITRDLGRIPVHLATDKHGLSLWNHLRKAGLDGVPVSWKSGGDSGGEVFSMVLTSAKRQAVPGSLLAVPAGYTETGMMGTFATPEEEAQMKEAMKGLEEQMKDMPPEQRKQMEEMMKRYGKETKK